MTVKVIAKSSAQLARSAFVGMTFIALAACSSAPARDADVYYDIRPQIAPVSFGTTQSLKLQSVSVKGLQSGRSLVLEMATAPVQFQEVRGHLWHVSPSELIETAVANALGSASQDLIIGTTDTIDNEDLRLKMIVEKFHFTTDQTAKISFDAVLKNKRGKIIFTKKYETIQASQSAGYQGAVSALEAALASTISQMAKNLSAAL